MYLQHVRELLRYFSKQSVGWSVVGVETTDHTCVYTIKTIWLNVFSTTSESGHSQNVSGKDTQYTSGHKNTA